MFDVEQPNHCCLRSDCKFLEEFIMLVPPNGSSPVFRCTLDVNERLGECPLYLKDLERLDIPNYKELNEELSNSNNIYYEEVKREHEQKSKYKKKLSKLENECMNLKKKNEFYQGIIDDIDKRLKPDRSLCCDVDHRRLTNDLDMILERYKI